MRKHYDFTEAQRNPYAKRLKKQTLINMYVKDCASRRKHLELSWRPHAAGP